jgi:Dyp-type peroxidase family
MAGPAVSGSRSPELADLQGLVKSGYTTLPYARFHLYTVGTGGAGRAFLQALLPRITSAAERDVAVVTQIALTATGLRALSVPAEVMAGFSLEFVTGIATSARSAFLGDTGTGDPTGWSWGGPGQPGIDVLVMIYAGSADDLDAAGADLDALAGTHRLSAAAILDTSRWSAEEPFGFRDGISQPRLDELASRSSRTPESPVAGRAVAIGEFVLGYPNEYGRLTERPILPRSADPGRLLPDDAGGSGGADLGRDGTYLVLRTLRQRVEQFWAYLEQASGNADPESTTALAAKFVGRWPSGAPLTLSPVQDRPELAQANEFGYHATDPSGRACPIGAHIRRANPRDSLDPHPGSAESLMVTDRHRLLRRGRKYGPEKAGGAPEDEHGLQFVALNANLSRQFEFVQHSWLNSAKFAGLYDDVDALSSFRAPGASTFTVQAEPFRRRYRNLPSFVDVRGGGYFFLPGLRALRYLAIGPAG